MLELVVSKKSVGADGVCVLELRAVTGAPLPAFEAGAHIDVQIRPGLVRQYSLCNPPAVRDAYRIAVLKAEPSRGGSAGLHAHVQVGQHLLVGAPRNLFPLVAGARHAVLLGGGIGITPLLSMAYQLHAAGASFELHYFSRSRACAAFVEELAGSAFAHQVSFHFNDDPAANQSVVRQLLAGPDPGDALYVCGPAGFIEACLENASSNGWHSDQLHHESFVPPSPGVALSTDGSFEVELASSGQVHRIPPDRSIYQVLEAAGIDLMVSCERGICGSCVLHVLEGEPDHRDQVLSDEEHHEQRLFTPCCSRARSARLVLDL